MYVLLKSLLIISYETLKPYYSYISFSFDLNLFLVETT